MHKGKTDNSKNSSLIYLSMVIYYSMKLKYAILFFLVLQLFQLNGQIAKEMESINADSLQQFLSTLTGTDKIDTLNSIAFRIAKDFPNSCRNLATRTISMSDSLNYQKGLADGYQNLGNSYMRADSLFPAMINYLNAARIYEQIDPSIDLPFIYLRLSWINFFAGRFRTMINYERKAIKVFKRLKTNEYLELRYNFIARAYMELGEYDSAIYCNKIAISCADSSINPWFYNTYGRIYLRQFNELYDTSLLDRSIEWFMKGLNSPEIDDYQTAGINANLFHAYYAYEKKEMDDLALYHLNQIIPSAKKSKKAFYCIY